MDANRDDVVYETSDSFSSLPDSSSVDRLSLLDLLRSEGLFIAPLIGLNLSDEGEESVIVPRYHRALNSGKRFKVSSDRAICLKVMGSHVTKILRWSLNMHSQNQTACNMTGQAHISLPVCSIVIIGTWIQGRHVNLGQVSLYPADPEGVKAVRLTMSSQCYLRLREFGQEARLSKDADIVRTAFSVGINAEGCYDGVIVPASGRRDDQE